MTEPDAGTPSISRSDARGSAAAALASVAGHHGLSILPDEIASQAGLAAVVELGDLIVASRMLGFESLPLEGSYDDLPSVELPAILVLKGEEPRFAVLHEVDETSSLLADPVAGDVRRVPRDELCAQWTGDCVQLVPDEEELAAARERLALHRSAWKRARAALRPPLGALKVIFLAGCVAVPALVLLTALTPGIAPPPAVSAAMLVLGVAALASLWLWLSSAGNSCYACKAAHQLAGALPLDQAGAFLYASLFVLALVAPLRPLVVYALCAASGAHLWLLVLLARRGMLCKPCVLIGLSAFTATALLSWACAGGGPETPIALSPALGIALAIGAMGAIRAAVPFFQQAVEPARLWEARRVALAALRTGKPTDGALRIVVWKRAGCPSCLIFESVHRSALLEELGDAIVIEEIDAGQLDIPVPLILIAAPSPVLFAGLPGTADDYAMLRVAIDGAREPAIAERGRLGGIHVVQGGS